MLYGGLLYVKLEQIRKHTSTVLYEEIKANPLLLEEAKAIIPKKDFLNKKIDTVKSKRELLNPSRPKLDIIYHYIYPEAVVRFQVIYDKKTSKIIDYGLDKQDLLRVE